MDNTWLNQIADVKGWLATDEALLLYQLAKKCQGKGVIVEIGSFHGKSTICLGNGSRAGQSLRVFAIDPHTGSPEHRQQDQACWTYDHFQANIRRAGLVDLVQPMVTTSKEAAIAFDQPIELLFIDGDHQYEEVKHDLELWLPKVIPGGIVALHDTISWIGPNRVVGEYFKDTKYFSKISRAGSITYGVKSDCPIRFIYILGRKRFFRKFNRVSAKYIKKAHEVVW